MTTKYVCQKGLQKTWATSTFTIDCRAVKATLPLKCTMQPFEEPQPFTLRLADMFNSWSDGNNLSDELLALLWCRTQNKRNTGKGKQCAFCAFVLCRALHVKFSVCRQCLFWQIQRDACNFPFLERSHRKVMSHIKSHCSCLQPLCWDFQSGKFSKFISKYFTARTTNMKLPCCWWLCILTRMHKKSYLGIWKDNLAVREITYTRFRMASQRKTMHWYELSLAFTC